jgi:glycosyltransferase involved in cell wall biosynthesis
MFVGRMIPDKGADVLLRAAALFAGDEVEVVIVGSEGFDSQSPLSRYERGLRKLASAVRPNVQFVPFVDRSALPVLLRSADILVVPSRWAEPSGLTLGEGLATGLPVIASRTGGIPEVLGSAGIMVEPNNPSELAKALRRLVDDPGLRLRMGREARIHAEAHDWGASWRCLRTLIGTES